MGKYPVYFIVALIFMGLIKLLQVTAFDYETYERNKKRFEAQGQQYSVAGKPTVKKTQESSDTTALDTIAPDSVLLVEQEADPDWIEEPQSSEEPQTEETLRVETASTAQGFSELKNLYLSPKIASLPDGQLRDDVVIRYYRHDQDGDKVFTLRDLGYYIHVKEADETAGFGSNVIYYGNDVANEDIQIVAYALLEAGLPIQAILPSSYDWKANAIEIGTDPELNSPILSEADVQMFAK